MVDCFRIQLEKAYKLCSPCKRVLQTKLHKEKEYLLGSKLMESRTPEKKYHNKKETQNEAIKNILNRLSIFSAAILFLLASVECCKIIMTDDKLPRIVTETKDITKQLVDRMYSIVKMKTLMTFPLLETYFDDMTRIMNLEIDLKPKILTDYPLNYDQILEVIQEALGGFACLLQILGHIFTVYKLKRAFAIDLLLTVFVITCLSRHSVDVTPILPSLIKVCMI